MSLSFIKKNLVVIMIVFLGIFFLLGLVFYLNLPPKPTNNTTDTKPQQGKIYDVTSDQSKIQLDHDRKVGELIKKLPFKGTHITLTYDLNNNKFVASYNLNQKGAAETELNNFLQQNRIDSTDWLYNFTVKAE